ncbi:hypothetical protein FG386_000535 [Cryptosporidium ryanae]|uniref:uncharacterized protein n=1 Tax=Cryptosporidium ryanae TaxID=515981 RepID=UPI003519F9AA|nr:hypothetical protein FG386_000535 [Cryptosporidium ryanae]
MNLMEIALKNGVKNTPNGPFIYPYSVRGRKPFSLLTDDESSDSSNNSENEEQDLNKNETRLSIRCDNEENANKNTKIIDKSERQELKFQERTHEYKSRGRNVEVEYISREDAFEIQYAKDFEFFFGVPYKPYIRMSKYRFGKNVKYPRDLKQEKAVYKKYPRYIFNDPWPEIDVHKPIPYVKQKQPPKLVNEQGIPISWVNIIERNKRYNIRKGNSTSSDVLEAYGEKEIQHTTLGDAVIALEVSSALLNGDLPSIIGEDKKSRKQKRFSFVRDNIRGVAEEIESWTKCPVIQTDISKYLESSWKNIDKYTNINNCGTDRGDSNSNNTEDLIKLKSISLSNGENNNKKKVSNSDNITLKDNNFEKLVSVDKSSTVPKTNETQPKESSLKNQITTQKEGASLDSAKTELPSKKSTLKKPPSSLSSKEGISSVSAKNELPPKETPSKNTSISGKESQPLSAKSELSSKGPPPKGPPFSKGPPPKKSALPSKKSS